MSGKETITKTLKFFIELKEGQNSILNRITARHTYAIHKYLEIIKNEEAHIFQSNRDISSRLDKLTITSKNRPSVKYDLKEATGLNFAQLANCGRKALEIFESYRVLYQKWDKRQEYISQKIIIKNLSTIVLDNDSTVSNPILENELSDFTASKLWNNLQKGKPSLPIRSKKWKSKKIPMRFFPPCQMMVREITDNRLFVRCSSLKQRKRIELELKMSDYHKQELKDARITSGKIIKNNKRKSWEFHLTIRKKIPQKLSSNKNAILGIDLGIATNATVIVLLENKQLSKKQFYFLKENELKKKKEELYRTIAKSQNKITNVSGNQRKETVKQLKNMRSRYLSISNEICHIIAKKIAIIALYYQNQNYNVHLAIGNLKGLRTIARKGNTKGKKYRGMIHRFSFNKLAEYITYKCREIGIQNIKLVREHDTSSICHKCDSKNTSRPIQSVFVCKECGITYNADANGAINIALRYWSMENGIEREKVKLIFLSRNSDEEVNQRLNSQGQCETTYRDESTQNFGESVEEMEKFCARSL